MRISNAKGSRKFSRDPLAILFGGGLQNAAGMVYHDALLAGFREYR
ncbi:MAG TPA: hypothetical protein PK967_08525 [Candidatus Hydrogenedentes bacterium]|nr:hypothetical protein [Candidatus Hydrogenedentota bacterium]